MRPTKYDDSMVKKLNDYFELPDMTYTHEKDSKDKIYCLPKKLPTFDEFSVKVGVDVSTLRNWANAKNDDGTSKYPEFLAAYTRARTVQSVFIQQNAFVGACPTSFARLMLTNFHEWKDRQEQTIEHSDRAIDMEEIERDLREAEKIKKQRRDQVQARSLIEKYQT